MSQWLAPGKGHELSLSTPRLLCSLCQFVQCPRQPGLPSGVCESLCCGCLHPPSDLRAMNGHRVQVLYWSVLVL